MNKILFALAGLSLLAAPAFAQTAQQNKMAECNKQATAKALKGDDRKKFMSECLKGGAAAAPAPTKPAPAAPAAPAAGAKKELPPKEAMSACAKKSKELGNKGDVHKKYMSDCLKAKGPDNVK